MSIHFSISVADYNSLLEDNKELRELNAELLAALKLSVKQLQLSGWHTGEEEAVISKAEALK